MNATNGQVMVEVFEEVVKVSPPKGEESRAEVERLVVFLKANPETAITVMFGFAAVIIAAFPEMGLKLLLASRNLEEVSREAFETVAEKHELVETPPSV